MSIIAAARPSPLPALNKTLPLVDPRTGLQTQITQQTLERHRAYVNGMGRIIPCSASTNSNVITLTPNDAAPSIEGYIFGDCFPFWADATSTGAVTATVVPRTGTLATLKVYLGDSSTQAGSGSVVINQLYIAQYLPIADSSAGGFVLSGTVAAGGQAKAQGRFNTSAALLGTSFNVSGVVRNSAGNFTVTLTTAMADTNYGVIATPQSGATVAIIDITITSTTVFTVNILNAAGTGVDASVCFAVFGDT